MKQCCLRPYSISFIDYVINYIKQFCCKVVKYSNMDMDIALRNIHCHTSTGTHTPHEIT